MRKSYEGHEKVKKNSFMSKEIQDMSKAMVETLSSIVTRIGNNKIIRE